MCLLGMAPGHLVWLDSICKGDLGIFVWFNKNDMNRFLYMNTILFTLEIASVIVRGTNFLHV